MNEIEQARDDLHFVREVMNWRSPGMGGVAAFYYFSAAWVLGTYYWLDAGRPYFMNWFLLLGIAHAPGTLRVVFGPATRQNSEIDRIRSRQNKLHFYVGIWVSVISTCALACAVPMLRGSIGGQVAVLLIGMVYFTWGIYRDRLFMLLGPLIMLGGVVVGMIPHYPWTCLGAAIAVGLTTTGFSSRRMETRRVQLESSLAQS